MINVLQIPLSRARWVLDHLQRTVTIDNSLKQQPKFCFDRNLPAATERDRSSSASLQGISFGEVATRFSAQREQFCPARAHNPLTHPCIVHPIKASLDETPSPAIRPLLSFVLADAQDRSVSLARRLCQTVATARCRWREWLM